jgi:hypothetical protein
MTAVGSSCVYCVRVGEWKVERRYQVDETFIPGRPPNRTIAQ